MFQKSTEDPNVLFDDNDKLFKSLVVNVGVYGEYGCGKSTSFVLNNTNAVVLSVDSSREWVKHIKASANGNPHLDLVWVDLGEVGDWGRPLSYKLRDKIPDYIKSICNRVQKPELVLIDGRFRVACFLYSLLHAKSGSIIVFDDYINRPKYHIVEEFVSRQHTCGRQGVFIVPNDIDRDIVEYELAKFIYVMD